MASTMTLAVLLALRDQLSPGLRQVQSNLERTRQAAKALQATGVAMMASGAAMMGTMARPITAYADAEDAATRLKVAMMGVGGVVDGSFGKVSDLATRLGDTLPGTTADFQAMMAVLKENGTASQAILDGVGESAAYLAVQLKMPADEAARFAARLSQAAGIASQDMMGFMDLIARSKNLGLEATEMGYAFGRSAGKLKAMGQTGLETARQLAPLFATLVPTLSGETVGTGFAAILTGLEHFRDGATKAARETRDQLKGLKIDLDLFDQGGQFRGIDNMVAQLDKLRELKPAELSSVIAGLVGTGQDAQMLATIIQGGVKGYEEVAARLAAQASLQQKVNAILGTLRNLWEAASGTFTNALAAFGEVISPELKAATKWFGEVSQQLKEWIKANPEIARLVGLIGAFGGAALVLGGALALAAGTAGLLLAPLAALVGPLSLAVAAGAALVAFNWDAVVAWIDPAKAKVLELWDGFKAWSAPAIAQAGEVWQAFKAGIPGALAQARELWASVADGAAASAAAVAGLGRGLASIAQPALSFGKGFFSEFLAEMSKSKEAGEVLAWLGEKLGALKTALGWVGEQGAAFGRWLSGLTGPTREAGEAAEAMGRSWGKAAAEILKQILALPGEIAKLAGAMWEAGAALMEGLKQGILAKFAAIKESIVGLGQSIKGWFSGATETHSPSRMFMRLGGFLTQGLALGIRAGTPAVLGEMGALAASLGNGVAPPSLRLVASNNRPLPNLSRTAAPPLRLAGRGGGSGSTVHFSPTINVTGGAAGPIKEAVNAALKLSMREFERVATAVDHAAARRGYA